MSEQEASGEALKTISTEDLLQELKNRLATSKDPNDEALTTAINHEFRTMM